MRCCSIVNLPCKLKSCMVRQSRHSSMSVTPSAAAQSLAHDLGECMAPRATALEVPCASVHITDCSCCCLRCSAKSVGYPWAWRFDFSTHPHGAQGQNVVIAMEAPNARSMDARQQAYSHQARRLPHVIPIRCFHMCEPLHQRDQYQLSTYIG